MHARRRARRWGARMGLFVLAESAVVVALVFFAVSLYLYAAQAAAPWLAAALTGLAALIVAALLVLVASLLRGRRHREASRSAGGGDADRVADAALEALLSGEKLHPSDMVMTSLVAGVVLGASPALRRQLAEHFGRRRDGDERSASSRDD